MEPEEIRAANLNRALRLVLPELYEASTHLDIAAGELAGDVEEYDELGDLMNKILSLGISVQDLYAEIKEQLST